MALKFQYRSDSITQARYAAALRDMVRQKSSTALTLTSGPTGTFGGTYLDMTAGPVVSFVGLDNCPIGSTAITILMRLIPIASGAPVANKGLISLGGFHHYNDSGYGGIDIGVSATTGKVEVTAGSVGNGGTYFSFANFATAPTWTTNTPTDIWIVWDGTTGSGKMELWQGDNGSTPTKISSLTASNAANAMIRGQVPSIVMANLPRVAFNNFAHVNEICIWDTAEVPSSYGTRTDFITATAYEGYTYTSLATNKVVSGTVYGPGPGTLTGTYVATYAAAGDVRSGTDRGDGTLGTLAVPSPGLVVSGTATDNTTGTYTAATQASVDALSDKVTELHKIAGLDATAPMTVTPTRRTAGTIDLALSGDGVSVTTVTRS